MCARACTRPCACWGQNTITGIDPYVQYTLFCCCYCCFWDKVSLWPGAGYLASLVSQWVLEIPLSLLPCAEITNTHNYSWLFHMCPGVGTHVCKTNTFLTEQSLFPSSKQLLKSKWNSRNHTLCLMFLEPWPECLGSCKDQCPIPRDLAWQWLRTLLIRTPW